MTLDIDLHRLAVVYLTVVHQGEHPTPAIAAEFGISRASVARYTHAARRAGLLPPGGRGCATPTDGDHWPRMVHLATGRARWLACLVCHYPWPCPDPATSRWLHHITRTEETAP